MSPVQSIPPTVTIASPPHSNNATSYYNNHNIIENYNNDNNNCNKYIIGKTTAATTTTKVMSDALSMGGGGGGSSVGAVSVEQSAVAAVAMWPYSHLYADRAAVAAAMYGHGPPIMFSSPAPHPMFAVSTPVPAHAYKLNNNHSNNNNNNNNNNNGGNCTAAQATITDSNKVFTTAYLKAIQNAVTASIFNPTQMTSQLQTPPPAPASSSQMHSQIPPAQTLTPPTPTLPKSPTLLAASMSSLAVSCAATSPNNIASAHSNNNNNKTYLNEKPIKSINVKNMTTTADVNYFKVPSGKEGSLKHRILTRPTTTPATTTNHFSSNCDENNKNAVMRTYDSTSNFRRGSYIELANGVLRKVEDMRTEDFIQCAERSPQHKLAESTVVKIDLTPANTVIITFSYDNNRSRADVEVSHDHPFFVYGQGWASYNPDASAKVFGLKCQRLQVGDICISLTIRDADANELTVQSQEQQQQQQQQSITPTTSTTTTLDMSITPSAMNMTMSAVQSSEYSRYQMPVTEQYVNTNVLPLSPHTPPAALVTSSNHLNLPPTHYAVAPGGLPYHLLPPHLTASLVSNTHPYTSAEMADLVSAYAYHAHLASTAPPPPTAKVLGNHHYYHHHHHAQPQSAHIYHTEGANMSKDNNINIHSSQDAIDFKPYAARYDALAPPVSTHAHHGYATDASHFLTHSHNHHQHHPHNHHQMHQPLHNQQPQQEEPVDATIARKRRWSAPEGVCEDDEEDIKHHPVRLSSVSSSTSSSSSSMQHNNNNNNNNNNSSNNSNNSSSGVSMYKIFKPAPVVAAAPPL